MLADLRKNQKWIIVVTAVLFILGMAVIGIQQVFSPKPYVGKIYGKKIHYATYDQQLRNYISNYIKQNPSANIDDQTFQRLNDEFWRSYSQQVIMEKQLKRYHIKVKDNEVLEKIKNEPPQELMSNPQFQTNGQFDKQKYMTALTQSPEFANAIEQYVRQVLPYEKLEKKIKAEVKIVEDSIRIDYVEKNDKVSGKVVFFDVSVMPEEKVTDAEIKAYYDKNKEEKYKKEASRKFKFVKFTVAPSKEDVDKAKTDIMNVYQLLQSGEDFAKLAQDYSQDPGSAKNGGDLGFVGKGRMIKEFEDATFNTPIGQYSAPFQTNFGWHIVKAISKRNNEKGEPEVQASHILISITPSEKTKMEFKEKADNFYELAEKKGLEKAAKEMKLEASETPEFDAKAEYIPMLGRFPHLVKLAFKKNVGFINEPLKIYDGSYIIPELSFKAGVHYDELDMVKNAIKSIIDREKRADKALLAASELAKQFQGEELIKQAQAQGLKILDVAQINKKGYVPEVGNVPDLNKELLALEVGKTTKAVKFERGAFVGFVTERIKPDMNVFNRDKKKISDDYKAEKENQHYSDWYRKVMEDAKVEDYRYMYY